MSEAVPTMLRGNELDDFGNPQACRQGFIPMARVELADMVKFESLAAFFNKYGKRGEAGAPVAAKQ